jgi:hypothetical protein
MARESTRKSGAAGNSGYASTMNSALLVCLAVAVAALGRIRLKSEENRLYSEISRLDYRLQEMRRLNRKLQNDYETLTSSSGLNTRIREMRLDLVMPGEDARVVLPEPPGGEGLVQSIAARPPPSLLDRGALDRGSLALHPASGAGPRRFP